MAITPKSHLVSPIRIYDANSSDYMEIIMGSGAPSGAADPFYSAAQGSLHIRGDATDDQPNLYLKVDNSGADDDWVACMVDKDEAAKSLEGILTMATDTAIYLRDSGQKIYSPAANVGALCTASGDVWRIGGIAGSDYVQVDNDGELTLAGSAMINQRTRFELFDDFVYQTIPESDTPWVLNAGSDDLAIDPAISSAECGVLRLTTGDGDGSTAVDASQVICAIPVQADSTELVFEARLKLTAITNVAVNVGLTDVTSLEEPFTIGASDTITSNASDAACFTFDTGADTDEWFMCAVDSDTDDTANATTGTAPTAGTYQIFRIEVDSDGATIRFYIDGTLEGTFSGDAGVSPDANLYATVVACGDGTASKTVDVDYLYVSHVR